MSNGKGNSKKIIRCSQCDEEFSNGYDYRMHWEKEHFYPYIGPGSCEREKAKKNIKTKKYDK